MLKHSRIRNSVKLITDKTRAVTGVLVKGKHSGLYQINAKAVVLATGGIGANAKRVQSLRPDINADVKTSKQPGSQGDGMVLAQKIGASVTDAKEIQLNPTLLVGSPVIVSETVRGARAVFVNKEGKRFISELTTRDVTSAAVSKQTGGVHGKNRLGGNSISETITFGRIAGTEAVKAVKQ